MKKIESTANVYLAAALIAVVVAAIVTAYVIIQTGTHATYLKSSPSVTSTQAPIATDSPASDNFTPSLTTMPLPQTSFPKISPTPTITPSPVPTPTLLLPTTTPIPTLIPTIPPTPTPTSTPIPTFTPSLTPTSTPSLPPTQTVTKSENWAGYAVASDLQNPQPTVTGVSASWTVPSVAPNSTDAFSAIWIGVGGKFDRTLIQCGTEQDSVGGQIKYSAWYELLPRNSRTISTINVSSGDEITASIQLSNQTADEWSINITDLTSGQSFQITVTYASSQLSAEWIVERPTVNRVLSPLANFGTISLSNCTATVGSATGTIGSLPANEIIMYSSITSGNSSVQLTNVSGLGFDGGGFTVDYLASN